MTLENTDTVSHLIDQFGGPEVAPEHHAKEGTLGYGAVHHALVHTMRPQNVLCVGSRRGFIPACLATAIKENGTGHLTFVDANYANNTDGPGVAWGGDGKWSDRDFGELEDVITVYLMRSDAFFDKNEQTFDYIYIDGAHDYDTVSQDLRNARGHLSERGTITLHDAMLGHPYGVRRALREMDASEWGTVVIPPSPGLAIVQRRAA